RFRGRRLGAITPGARGRHTNWLAVAGPELWARAVETRSARSGLQAAPQRDESISTRCAGEARISDRLVKYCARSGPDFLLTGLSSSTTATSSRLLLSR